MIDGGANFGMAPVLPEKVPWCTCCRSRAGPDQSGAVPPESDRNPPDDCPQYRFELHGDDRKDEFFHALPEPAPGIRAVTRFVALPATESGARPQD
jgi:hypothetical protein